MLKDEFNRLLKIFHDGSEGKPINLEEVFSESLHFFQHLKEQIAKGTPEEKKEAVEMMTQMYAKMMDETKKICERSGLSEEQLMSFAENPSNFAPEQWRRIQESKDKIYHAGQDLANTIREQTRPHKAKEEKKPPRKGPKRPKRDDWLKS